MIDYKYCLKTEYKWFEAETADEKHRFYVGIPHEAELAADIAAFCMLEGFEEAVGTPDKDMSVEDIPLHQDSKRSRSVRRAHLKQERLTLFPSTFGGAWSKERKEEIDKELEHLRESDAGE